MTTHRATAVHNKNMTFTANINGHQVKMDTSADEGGNDSAPSPKRMMLAAITGCTGMDIVMILNKMKVKFSDLSIDVEADVRKEYPKIYTRTKLIYKIRMEEKDRPKMEKAVTLSQEKYCSVSGMFRAFSKMETEIIILK